ncbi:hypothetical protein QBC43DRAFT_315524 [Cladorrhinum sp. PSN259]|nr:hypothetical protein QBC43DRAFT_315524 [Cladorrhinum sp. PSN259]
MHPVLSARQFGCVPSLARTIPRPVGQYIHHRLQYRGFKSTPIRLSPGPFENPPPFLNIFSGMSRWGWVVYRTAYGPGTDELWARYQPELKQHTSAYLAKIQAAFDQQPPKGADVIPWDRVFSENDGGLEWSFISDQAALDGAKIEDVREIFKNKVKEEGLFSPNWAYFAVADDACLKGEKKVVLVKMDKDAKVDMTFGADGSMELPWDELGMRSINIKLATVMLQGMLNGKLPEKQ